MSEYIHLFWKSNLSQWTRSQFPMEGSTYNCAEQAMMAEKARLFGDDETLKRIMEEREPGEQKNLGREIKNFDQKTWDDAKFDIVKKINLFRFSHDKQAREDLLATGHKIIAEANPHDKIWGIGMGSKNPDAQCPSKWNGENLLGKVLMEVRDKWKFEVKLRILEEREPRERISL